MEGVMSAVDWRGLANLVVVLGGILAIYLGYRLYVLGVSTTETTAEIKTHLATLVMNGAGPGIGLVFLGAAVLMAAIVTGGATTDNQTLFGVFGVDEPIRSINAREVDDDPEEAKRVVQSIEENPEAPRIDKALAGAIDLAIDFQRQGRIEEAAQQWRAIASFEERLDPDLAAEAWFSVGYLVQHGDREASIDAYTQAIRLRPTFADAYYNRGNVESDLSRYQEAIADYGRSIDHEPSARAYFNRGNAHLDAGECRRSIEDYDNAARRDESYRASASHNRVRGLIACGEITQAQTHLRDSIGLASDPERTLRDLSLLDEIVNLVSDSEFSTTYTVEPGSVLRVVMLLRNGGELEQPRIFPLVGTVGNSGSSGSRDAPGGQGYSGGSGFLVTVATDVSDASPS